MTKLLTSVLAYIHCCNIFISTASCSILFVYFLRRKEVQPGFWFMIVCSYKICIFQRNFTYLPFTMTPSKLDNVAGDIFPSFEPNCIEDILCKVSSLTSYSQTKVKTAWRQFGCIPQRKFEVQKGYLEWR